MDWSKKPYKWAENGRDCYSISFTFQLPEIRQEILDGNLASQALPLVGGPAVKLMPHYLSDIAEIGGEIPGMLQRINPNAAFSSRGCVNRCGFCAVPIIEGEFRELDDWPDVPILCDNNILACSRAHFDKVIDRQKRHTGVDFNQGLDTRLMTKYHADRLAELDGIFRLAWDNTATEQYFLRAVELLTSAGIPTDRIRCYVLIGYRDTPEDALYRLETCWHKLGVMPNCMRYIPLDSLTRHYVGPGWTHKELTRMSRYWNNLNRVGKVPYTEWDGKNRNGRVDSRVQPMLDLALKVAEKGVAE